MDSTSCTTTDDQLISCPNQGVSNSDSAVESLGNQIKEKLHVDAATVVDGDGGEGTSSSATDLKDINDNSASASALPSQDKHGYFELSLKGTIALLTPLFNIPNPSIENIHMLLTTLSKFLEKTSEDADLTNALITHALSVWKHALKYNVLIQEFFEFPVNLCKRLEDCKRFEEMLQLAHDSVPNVVQLYGQESCLKMYLKYFEARALIELNKRSDAIKILEEIRPVAVAAMKKSETFPNRLTLGIVLSLSECYGVQGNHKDRLTIIEETVTIRMKTLPENRDTLILRNVKILTLHKLGKIDEALAESESLYEVAKRTLGEDDILTLETKSSIGTLLMDKGKLEDGLKILQTVYTAMERTLGKEHPRTVKCARSIKSCHWDMWLELLELE